MRLDNMSIYICVLKHPVAYRGRKTCKGHICTKTHLTHMGRVHGALILGRVHGALIRDRLHHV